MRKIKEFIRDHFEGVIILLVFIGVLTIAFLISHFDCILLCCFGHPLFGFF